MNAQFTSKSRAAAVILACALPLSLAQAQPAYPMSRCVFQLPYWGATTQWIQVNSQNVLQFNDHNGTDMTGNPPIPLDPNDPWPEGYPLVAMQDGIVRWVDESNTGCCWTNCGDCNNRIYVEHFSGDFSAYAHIAPGGAVVGCGDLVSAGQIIAIEGDTGRTCSNGGVNNRPATSCNGQGPDPNCPFCGVHLHLSTFYGYDPSVIAPCASENPSGAFAGQTIPVFCNIAGNVLTPGATYPFSQMGACEGGCDNEAVVLGEIITPTSVKVLRANDTILAINLTVNGPSGGNRGASVSYRAGDKITLGPDTRIEPGSFFLGIISSCDGCPPPRN